MEAQGQGPPGGVPGVTGMVGPGQHPRMPMGPHGIRPGPVGPAPPGHFPPGHHPPPHHVQHIHRMQQGKHSPTSVEVNQTTFIIIFTSCDVIP